ncbi:SDR family NAD(P)-dependent oxidoreductase [Crossiella sp. CA-258035]|uniref:SDR family oxidoreductase n=1 Tax=Crossiella sp. CA-258035 TaxID=2981138 RepID=UPI0024BD0596|nr:SDR family oxidoreductase [Crossiella sp. CA-258035]WHT15930.1 SDR family NAD(P)-dependent oxidoreductase [Crossiella sp. CA-258035]
MNEVGVILVTGGASGLGAAVVRAVHEAGGTALVLDKDTPAADIPAKDALTVDLTDTAAAEDAVAKLAERAGGLDGVVTAAGIDSCGPLDGVSTMDWERVVRVNLFGTAAVVRAALPYLKVSRGRVVTVASTLGLRVAGDATAYCASKFGVVGFTRALAMETAGEVGVTLLVPGGMRTRFFDSRTEQYRPADDSKLNPPERVADTVLFALRQPAGCQLRELVVCHEEEPSWP